MDAVDLVILDTLRTDGRATFAELGRRVGLSAPAAHERVRRLEESGAITGYHASVDPRVIGLGVCALVGVLLRDDVEQDELADRLRRVRAVEDCWLVAGDEAFVCKIRAPDVDALEGVLGSLRRVPGVARTRTTVVLSTRWEGRPVPVARPVPARSPDPAGSAGGPRTSP